MSVAKNVCAREWVGSPVSGNFGVLDRRALEQADLTVTYAEGPSLVADHAFTTGQIGLRSFERVLSPSTMKVGFADGIGSIHASCLKKSRLNRLFPISSNTNSPSRLISRDVVLSSSPRVAIVASSIPSSRRRRHLESKVHAVIGGFYLAPYEEDYVRQTIAALKEIKVDYVIPLHCSGEVFYELAKAECQQAPALLHRNPFCIRGSTSVRHPRACRVLGTGVHSM